MGCGTAPERPGPRASLWVVRGVAGAIFQGHVFVQRGELEQARGQQKQQDVSSRRLLSRRQQGAKALELRAAMSLSRLWQTQGKHTAARALLAEMYGWFTEGFDRADLQEARGLLQDLSS